MMIDEGFTGQVSVVSAAHSTLTAHGHQTYVYALYMYWGLLDVYSAAEEYCEDWLREVIRWKIFQ